MRRLWTVGWSLVFGFCLFCFFILLRKDQLGLRLVQSGKRRSWGDACLRLSVLGWLRQQDQKSRSSLGHMERLHLKNSRKEKENEPSNTTLLFLEVVFFLVESHVAMRLWFPMWLWLERKWHVCCVMDLIVSLVFTLWRKTRRINPLF